MARTPVIGAGGIVVRSEAPLIAVVRLRKRDHWVLPKGKLDPGESARDAAEREAVEETGHDVTVHEFVGTVAYEIRGGPKVVHFWRMEAEGDQAHELMRDISTVAWLPLDAALARLTREHERAFLAEVGPRVLHAAHGLGAAPRQTETAPLLPAILSRPEAPALAPAEAAARGVSSRETPARATAAKRQDTVATVTDPAIGSRVAVDAPATAPGLGDHAPPVVRARRQGWLSRLWHWLWRRD